MSYKTVIIGLGNIGLKYDYNFDHSEYILTHSQAVNAHPDFELVAGFDTNIINREQFEKKFKRPSYSKLDSLNNISEIDVVVISVPTEFHLDAVKKVFKFSRPNLILIEKPLAFSMEDAQKILLTTKENNIPILVNYIRNFEPKHIEFMKNLKKGSLGFPLSITCFYNGGLINNLSHVLNMLNKFMGKSVKIKIYDKGEAYNKYDYEPGFIINYEKGSVNFSPLKNLTYSIIELDIFGPKGRYNYKGHGLFSRWIIEKDPIFKGYKRIFQNYFQDG